MYDSCIENCFKLNGSNVTSSTSLLDLTEVFCERGQVSPCKAHASDRVRPCSAGQLNVSDDRSLSQRLFLLPGMRHAQHGLAYWQAVLERPTIRLVRHCQVRHESGTKTSRTLRTIIDNGSTMCWAHDR